MCIQHSQWNIKINERERKKKDQVTWQQIERKINAMMNMQYNLSWDVWTLLNSRKWITMWSRYWNASCKFSSWMIYEIISWIFINNNKKDRFSLWVIHSFTCWNSEFWWISYHLSEFSHVRKIAKPNLCIKLMIYLKEIYISFLIFFLRKKLRYNFLNVVS